MVAAMAAAEVGDDQYGEDPTINRLQDRVAELLGKEMALWFPTGTMADQVALRALTRPGDDVIVSRESHVVWHEVGGGAVNAGVQFTEIGTAGVFTAAQFIAAIKPQDHFLYPGTSLVSVEDTHNRAGGVVFPAAEASAICEAAREHGINSFLDGARLWNAAVASGRSPMAVASPFDLVSVAMSKGLGAPGGSLLAGPRDLLPRLRRFRRMSGGAMRQIGSFGAAGLYALEHNLDRLAEDHANARHIADVLAGTRNARIDPTTVRTNVVVCHLREDGPDAAMVVARARERGVLLNALGPRTLRAVTHLDVSREACDRAAGLLAMVIDAGPGRAASGARSD
ncbi:MAG: aminotransferase class I/II-fold pyridoxal phosphate-dependent enzyme [Chloroflexi bacterium]|nr:aminotransferase class I/II-fold pyridoxal phosphate-dependent enzyme [Chloroflexota bacterium]